MTSSDAIVGKILTEFFPFDGSELQLHGKSSYARMLSRFRNSGVDSVYITDGFLEESIQLTRESLDSARDDQGRGILHYVAVYVKPYQVSLLTRLLALGVNPDLPDDGGRRPSHCCSNAHRLEPCLAEILSACRPDLTRTNLWGQNPQQVAKEALQKTQDITRRQALARIHCTWKRCAKDGFPSLPRLAREERWYAVQNLCRRKAVRLDEIYLTYSGKNVLEWAEHHGQMKLAAEIRFLFKCPAAATGVNFNWRLAPSVESGLEDDDDLVDDEAVDQEMPALVDDEEPGPNLVQEASSVAEILSNKPAGVSAICADAPTGFSADEILAAVDSLLKGIRKEAVAGRQIEVLTKLTAVTKELAAGKSAGPSEPRNSRAE